MFGFDRYLHPDDFGQSGTRPDAHRLSLVALRMGARRSAGRRQPPHPRKGCRGSGPYIKEGKIYQLGRVYEFGMPLFGNRHFSLTMPGLPTGGPLGTGQIVYNDEMVSGELGQIGTQFDGLGHIGTRVDGEDIFYNGFKLSEFGDTYGLTKLGVERVGPIFTRGVLLDVAGYKGVDRTWQSLDEGQRRLYG